MRNIDAHMLARAAASTFERTLRKDGRQAIVRTRKRRRLVERRKNESIVVRRERQLCPGRGFGRAPRSYRRRPCGARRSTQRDEHLTSAAAIPERLESSFIFPRDVQLNFRRGRCIFSDSRSKSMVIHRRLESGFQNSRFIKLLKHRRLRIFKHT
jgi:hypothetical protein